MAEKKTRKTIKAGEAKKPAAAPAPKPVDLGQLRALMDVKAGTVEAARRAVTRAEGLNEIAVRGPAIASALGDLDAALRDYKDAYDRFHTEQAKQRKSAHR